MEQNQDQIETFLDASWLVIGRLHRWLSACQLGARDQTELVESLGGLQKLWSAAEDLRLNRISYSCLALEQLLERFCAGNLEINTERLMDVTAGVELLQELLLGLEATREEPVAFDLQVLLRLQRHISAPVWINRQQPVATLPAAGEIAIPGQTKQVSIETVEPVAAASSDEEVAKTAQEIEETRHSDAVSAVDRISVESTLLAMLEQFVSKVDDTCHRLHTRVVADHAPYVTTTTRLQHLIEVTRELVGQLSHTIEVSSLVNEAVAKPEPKATIESFDVTSEETSQPLVAELIPMTEAEDTVDAILQSGLADLSYFRRPILIVEESLFYRQMISMAVRSMGFDSIAVESVDAGCEQLRTPQGLCAVLVDVVVTPAMSEILQACRRDCGIKVIGMTSTISEGSLTEDFDDQVARSNPRQLREILSRLLDETSSDTRQSA